MLTPPGPAQNDPLGSYPLFGDAKVFLDETPKAVSPFGGLASFIAFLGQIGFARQVRRQLTFAWANTSRWWRPRWTGSKPLRRS